MLLALGAFRLRQGFVGQVRRPYRIAHRVRQVGEVFCGVAEEVDDWLVAFLARFVVARPDPVAEFNVLDALGAKRAMGSL